MSPTATTFDLTLLSLGLGETSTHDVDLYLPPLSFACQDYLFKPDVVKARLEFLFTGHGYHTTIDFSCRLEGACWRCLEPADLDLEVRAQDFFETELPPLDEIGEDDEASMWYSLDGVLDISAWAHDAVAELLPPKVLCFPLCRGLCPQCGANLNEVECDCEPPTDFRWEKLKDWKPEV